MPDRLVIGKVHGRHSTYVIYSKSGIWCNEYYIRREPSGKLFGSYASRARAFEAAHEMAGSGAYES